MGLISYCFVITLHIDYMTVFLTNKNNNNNSNNNNIV